MSDTSDFTVGPREEGESGNPVVSSITDDIMQISEIKNGTHSELSEEKISTTKSENNDVLICGLCLKYMQNPKWLPCLHSYCSSCLEILQEEKSKTLDEGGEKTANKIDLDHKPSKVLSDNDLIFTSSPIKQENNQVTLTSESKKILIVEEDNSGDKAGFDQFEKVQFSPEEVSSNDGVFSSGGDHCQKESSNKDIQTNKTNVAKEKGATLKKSGDPGKPMFIACPACKETCYLPPEGINGLMTNFVFSSLIQMKEKLTQIKHCEICKLRDITEVAVAICKDCSDLLCKSCWQSHSFTRYTLSHKVLPLEEIDSIAVDDTFRSRAETKCPVHFDEILKYFCQDCKCLVCRECVLLSHQGHSCVSSSAAAESKKKDFEILFYGHNEMLHSLRKDEYDEYKIQNERISNAERVEIKKVDSFFQELLEAIEKARNDFIECTQKKFEKLKKRCDDRFASSQIMEKKMTNTESVLKLVLKQASDEEFLEIEPFLHQRMVHVMNKKTFKPFPISWYEMPVAVLQNPINITCEMQKINVSCFKIKDPLRKFDATEAIPCQNTLEELVKMGKFKGTTTHESEMNDQEKEDIIQKLHKDPNFIDATIWPNENVTNVPIVPESSNDMEILASCSDSSASGNNELPSNDKETSPEIKKKRGKRGGKKNKKKGKLSQLQNMFQGMSLHSKGMIGQPQTGLYGNSYATALFGNSVNAFGTCQGPLSIQDMPSYVYPQSENMQQVFSVNARTEVQDNFKKTVQAFVSRPQKSMPVVKSSQQTGRYGSPSPVKQPSPSVTKGNKSESTTSNYMSATATADVSMTPNKVISLQPKFRLDVKLSADVYEPVLNGVYCLHKTSIIVSDTKNGKVKTFSIEGQFIRSIDILGVQRAIFTVNTLVYCSKNEVHCRKEDGGEFNPLKYDGKGGNNCLLTWFPKNHILVASGKQVRQYALDLEKGNFLKTQFLAAGRFEHIQDIRCDQHGKKLVVIEASTKSVVICTVDGQTIGNYKEDTPVWNPTSACFDKKGYVFVTDGGGNRLLFLSPSGQFVQQWDTCPTINRPTFVATNSLQPVYITGHDRYVHVYDYSYC